MKALGIDFVASPVSLEQFERHAPVEFKIGGAINDSVAAPADDAVDPVTGENRTYGWLTCAHTPNAARLMPLLSSVPDTSALPGS